MIMRVPCHHEVCGTCSQEEGSLQCPPFLTCLFCPREKMGGLKNNWFFETEVTFFAHWATWLAEAKREKSVYDEPPSLGIPK